MSGKKRTTVSLEPGIIAKARVMMKEDDFGDFSGFLEQVIRERWECRKDAPSGPKRARSRIHSATGNSGTSRSKLRGTN